MSDDDDFQPWTTDGAARLREAAADLVAAITAHVGAISAVDGEVSSGEVAVAGARLLPAVLAYADAQFNYTGNSFPFGVLHQYADDADEGEEELDGEGEGPTTGISVLQRRDYQVTDEAAVLEAGRRAYLQVWPEDDEAAALADVTHLGRALYQVAHAEGGWNNLDQIEGMRPTAGVVLVVQPDELLAPDADAWPEDPLGPEGELLYQQSDVFHP